MGSLGNYALVAITRDTLSASRRGFGTPLLLSYYAAWAERVREYTSYAEVIVDFPVTTGPEAIFAAQAFAQDPHVETLKIGRGALKPTQVYTLVPVVQNTHAYRLRVGGKGVTTTEISVTSDGTATATEICDLLRTAVNAVVGKNFTATGTTTLIITGDAAGDWFWVEQLDLADFTLAQTHADPGVATDLAAIAVADPDFYDLYTTHNSNAFALAAAGWVESNERVYTLESNETTSVTTTVGNSETLDDVATLARTRTYGIWHQYPVEMEGAAETSTFSYDPGSETFALKPVGGAGWSGVTPDNLTSTQRANLVARKANGFEPVGDSGFAVTYNGTVASGEYLDVIRALDFIKDDISKGLLELLVAQPKLSFDDAGIAQVKALIQSRLDKYVRMLILVEGTTGVTVPRAADVSPSDKALRRLTGVRFSGDLAGAIHFVGVNGTVSL